jgi:hypothetical protein
MTDYISDETVTSQGLSNYGIVSAIHADLIKKRNAATDEGERHRLNTLIQNAVELKRDPFNQALMKQFGRNAQYLATYLADRQSGSIHCDKP